MKQKLRLLVGCALLLLPCTLLAKTPKGQHPQRVDPKALVDEAKKELHKEIQAVRQDLNKARKEIDVVRQQSYRVHTACFLQVSKEVLGDRDPIPFPIHGMPKSEITYEKGVFILPYNGMYMVTYGVTTSSASQAVNHFELYLDSNPVIGGKVYTTNHSVSSCTGAVTVQFEAKAGQHLQVLNVTGSTVSVGSDKKDATAAYISILQVH